MRNPLIASVAILAVVGLALGGLAFAGDDVASDKPVVKTETPVTKAKAETATPSPIVTMMKWVGKHVAAGQDCDCPCPATASGEKAWRVWFKKTDGPLADLRASMIKDGWNADRTVTFFKAMAAKKAKGSCGGCDKSKTDGAAAPTGDAGTTGDAKSSCGGCDKSKAKSDCGGCDKSKGAAAPTGDAGATGDSSKCPCTGKNKADCGGCDKSACPCGKDDKAPAKTDG